jgi:hypothetical protein
VDGQGSGLVGGYETGLQRYVDSGDEVELEAAYAFSREAFGAEMTILDVVDVHRRAVERLVGLTVVC